MLRFTTLILMVCFGVFSWVSAIQVKAQPAGEASEVEPPPPQERKEGERPQPPPSDSPRRGQGGPRAEHRSGPFDPANLPPHIRKRFESASESERETIRRNFQRLAGLPEGDREKIRERMGKMRDVIQQEVETVLAESGLTLSEEQKRKFTRRYAEERRILERAIREEMDRERTAQLASIVDRLKSEFAAEPDTTASE